MQMQAHGFSMARGGSPVHALDRAEDCAIDCRQTFQKSAQARVTLRRDQSLGLNFAGEFARQIFQNRRWEPMLCIRKRGRRKRSLCDLAHFLAMAGFSQKIETAQGWV